MMILCVSFGKGYAVNVYICIFNTEIAVRSIAGQDGCKGLDAIIKICQEKPADLLNMNMFEVLGSEKNYASFLLFCAQSVRPYSVYIDKVRCKEDIDNWITSDDDALCWVILQNSVERWNSEYALRNGKRTIESEYSVKGIMEIKLTKEEKHSLPPSLYTESKIDTKRKFCGWDETGIKAFREVKHANIQFRKDSMAETGIVWKGYNETALDTMVKELDKHSPSSKRKAASARNEMEKMKAQRLESLYSMKGLSRFSNIESVAL